MREILHIGAVNPRDKQPIWGKNSYPGDRENAYWLVCVGCSAATACSATGSASSTTALWLIGAGEDLVDGAKHLEGVGCDVRVKAGDDLAFVVDDELGVVPCDVAAGGSAFALGEVGVEGELIVAEELGDTHDGEVDLGVGVGLEDFRLGAWFGCTELVGRDAEDDETLVLVGIIELDEGGELVVVGGLSAEVDDEDVLALVGGDGDIFAVGADEVVIVGGLVGCRAFAAAASATASTTSTTSAAAAEACPAAGLAGPWARRRSGEQRVRPRERSGRVGRLCLEGEARSSGEQKAER